MLFADCFAWVDRLYPMIKHLSPALRARVESAWPELLARIAAGAELGDTLKALGLTRDAVRAYRYLVDKAEEQYQLARKESAAAMFEELRILAKTRSRDQVEAADKRAEMDIVRWMIMKLDPKNYSDKAQLDVNVKTMDLTDIVNNAAARLAAHRAAITVSHTQGALPSPASRAQDTMDAELVRSVADLQ